MADEYGPTAVEHDLIRGQIPERLLDLALAQAELWRAAAPWTAGVVPVPLAQLQDLAAQAGALARECERVVAEARAVYRQTRQRQQTLDVA